MKLLEAIKKILSSNTGVIWLLSLAGGLLYLNCLPNEMFWDDNDFILHNIYIQDWQYWTKFFTDNIISGAHLISNYWRPMLQFVFAIEWHLWGNWVYGWHAVSILFHTADGVLIFLIIKKLRQEDHWLAFLTSAMFIIHPAQTEAVVYPNAMGDSLATFFILLGIYFYTRSAGKMLNRHYFLALACYPLAILSKETGILLVAFLAILDFFMLHEPRWNSVGKIFKRLSPFMAIAIGYIILRATVLNFSNSFNFYNESNAFTSHTGTRILTFFKVLSLHAGFLFIPYDLRVERALELPKSILELDVLWGIALLTGLITAAVKYWKKTPLITFGIAWFLIALTPTSNIFVIINGMVYEHWLYTAMIGLWLVVFWLGIRLAGNKTLRPWLVFLTAVVFIGFSVRTMWRNTDWRTAIGFYEKLAPTCPKSYKVINNLGMEYAEKGLADKAEIAYKKAIALDPKNAVAYHNLANIYAGRKNEELAIQYFEKAISLQENFIFSYRALAQLYVNKKEFTKARVLLEKYFNLSDDKDFTINALIQLALLEKDYDAARKYIGVALQLSPGNPGLMALLRKINNNETQSLLPNE
ncbi:MAG: tetratricopeptide repeat protein [Candidatus Omnitrophica bacterium]|nr:tetratricopeptide repeat protein [Candidatus Omnitrophota bacterium]